MTMLGQVALAILLFEGMEGGLKMVKTKTISIDEDMITGAWNPSRYCFEFYIFSKDSEPLEKGEILMRIPAEQMHETKGIKRDMQYIQKRLDEINERAHIIVEKLKPTHSTK